MAGASAQGKAAVLHASARCETIAKHFSHSSNPQENVLAPSHETGHESGNVLIKHEVESGAVY